jgi:hypothetical protein
MTNPAAADAVWAASDALHVAVDILGSRILRQAADSYARAARCGYGRIPRPTAAGNRLRATARLLTLAATVGDEDRAMVLVAKLAIAVAELRDTQRHAAQASAARAAAERLYATTRAEPARARFANMRPTARPYRRVRTTADRARLVFPYGSGKLRTASGSILGARTGPAARTAARQPTTKTTRTQPVGGHVRPEPGAGGR